MKDNVKNSLDKYVSLISSQDGVLQVYLFGSYANGTPHNESDIDLMVIIEDRLDAKRTAIMINNALIGMRDIPLDILVNRSTDFGSFSEHPTLQKQIKNKGVLLYDKRLLQELGQYARNDLSVAIREMERTTNPRQRPFEIILYHCQQSAEKMLKAFLVHNGATGWGHDLDALRLQCASFDIIFSSARHARHCAFLTAFSTVRYPDYSASIDAGDAARGLNSAKRIFDFVSERLGLKSYS